MTGIRISSRIFAHWIGCLAFGALCLAAVVRADTVKLNDGTVLEGDILSENETQLTINAEFASGTITEKQTVNKSDIAPNGITRLTDEQKAAREMERDYQKLQHYQLDPANTFTLSQYDKAINDVFHPFLVQYTNSPYIAQVQDKIAQWQTERDEVASGKARYKGQWMSAESAAALFEHDHIQHLFDLGDQYLTDRKFSAARDQFRAIISSAKEPELIDRAKDLCAQTCHQWLEALQLQQQTLGDEIKAAEEHLNHVRSERDQAEDKLKHAIADQKHSTTYFLGDSALVAKDNADYDFLRSESENAVTHVDELRQQAVALEKQINDLQPKVVTNAEEPPPPPPPGTLWDQSLAWMKKNWIFAAVGGLIGLWAFSRLFN